MGNRKKKFAKNKAKLIDSNAIASDDRTYNSIVKQNESFETYYKTQHIVIENDWQLFMSTVTTALPSAFRITSYCMNQAIALRTIVKSKHFKDLMPDSAKPDENGAKLCPLSSIEWYPNSLGWQINVSRVEIRKSESFRRLQNFLISETESGYISRQEAVSMIPPLLLDVEPQHRVLDMCAAPGSKTAQIIELLHSSNEETSGCEGVVVANDVNNKRCYMLVHQSKRLHSPCCVITNHDAGNMPNFYEYQNGNRVVLKFDRILCDVPCSGDGTIRKNYDVWTKWNVANGNNFHGIQLRIAKRGLEMLKKDGIMVYSTCSLNPIEDEAVIASLLNMCSGGAHIVDVSHVLPLLKYNNGLENWTVMTREMVVVNSLDEVEEKYKSQIRESLFPPKNVKELNLNRCMRILPHMQDTGGFFVAVIKKTVETLPWETGSSVDSSITTETVEENIFRFKPPKKKAKIYGYKEDPFIFFNESENDWPNIKSYYSIKDSFPFKQLVHRCTYGKKRNIYFLTETAKKLISDNSENIKFVNGGVRLFSRSDDKVNSCGFRLTQEGLPSLYPYLIPEKVVEISVENAKLILSQESVSMETFDEQIREKFLSLNSGCCVLVVKINDYEDINAPLILPFCAWKGKSSMRAYIEKNEKIHFLRLCGSDVYDTEVRRSTERDKNKLAKKSGDAITDEIELIADKQCSS